MNTKKMITLLASVTMVMLWAGELRAQDVAADTNMSFFITRKAPTRTARTLPKPSGPVIGPGAPI
jgi:hypothetical protein